jgi:pilus assembly protein CpaB
MDRRTRAFIVVGLAAVLATGAAFGVYRAIQTRPVVQVPIAERFTVVAARTIPVGTQLTTEMVRVVGWPSDSPVAGGFAKPEEVVGRGVTVGLVENEPIVESKLSSKGQGGGLSTVITPGMRALAVRVNDIISVAGYVLPGSHVDVIVTLRPAQESISRIVLTNVKVLSTGPNIDTAQARDGKPAQNPPLVTLELTPTDAERLSLAMNQGQIALALRNPMDVEKVETSGARMSGLLGSQAPEPIKTVVRGQTRMVAPPPPPPPPKPPSVEVIAGNTRKEQIIK